MNDQPTPAAERAQHDLVYGDITLTADDVTTIVREAHADLFRLSDGWEPRAAEDRQKPLLFSKARNDQLNYLLRQLLVETRLLSRVSAMRRQLVEARVAKLEQDGANNALLDEVAELRRRLLDVEAEQSRAEDERELFTRKVNQTLGEAIADLQRRG